MFRLREKTLDERAIGEGLEAVFRASSWMVIRNWADIGYGGLKMGDVPSSRMLVNVISLPHACLNVPDPFEE